MSSGLVTVQEAAEHLRVHPETIRRMIKRGEISAVKVGSVYRISADDLAPTRVVPIQREEPVDASPLARFVRPEWRHPSAGGV
jgi:excisionase family DNA binding protein